MQDTKAKLEHYSEKVVRFQGKNKDPTQLSQQIVEKLSAEGYKTQSTTVPLGIIIQAQKAGVLRGHHRREQSFHHLDCRAA